jgi:protein-S-isoprenylcysteine O-methyltransferase Ste14
MVLRALAAFVILPGVVAGLFPLLIVSGDPWRYAGNPIGWLVLVPGVLFLSSCVRDFLVLGQGTLAPWDPPRRLVTRGMYRFTRNPMYTAVVLVTAGWSICAGSPLLAGYTVCVGLGFHLRVILAEEPRLKNQFGPQWDSYRSNVNRWIPRSKH